MRPRVIPADDLDSGRDTGRPALASMRPRVIPADDSQPAAFSSALHNASMRPRVIPADDGRHRLAVAELHVASMRPRVIPADDWLTVSKAADFNRASMRPRVIPADDGPLATRCNSEVFTTRSREVAHSCRTIRTDDGVTCDWLHCNSSVINDLPAFEHSSGIPAALERSHRRGATPQMMTGSRRTAWNFLPRLTTRGSTPSATPMSTSTTWSSA